MHLKSVNYMYNYIVTETGLHIAIFHVNIAVCV